MKHQTSDDILSNVFDVEPITQVEKPQGQLMVSTNNEKEDDFQYVRTNLYDLIDKGSEAVANALAVAAESQHPRAYEVAGNLIKNIADLTDKLVTLQKTKATLEPQESQTKSNLNIDKAVIFNGSTAELLKMIKNESSSS
jgi:predicted MPP superfamily phosphohydrolase